MLNKWFIHLVTLSANKPQCPFQFILKLGRHFLGAKIIFSSFHPVWRPPKTINKYLQCLLPLPRPLINCLNKDWREKVVPTCLFPERRAPSLNNSQKHRTMTLEPPWVRIQRWVKFFYQKHNQRCRCCGPLGRQVASDDRGPQFKSSQCPICIHLGRTHFTLNCRIDENKEKGVGNGLLKIYLVGSNKAKGRSIWPKRLILHLVVFSILKSPPAWPVKSRQKLPKNEFTRKMKYFDTFKNA